MPKLDTFLLSMASGILIIPNLFSAFSFEMKESKLSGYGEWSHFKKFDPLWRLICIVWLRLMQNQNQKQNGTFYVGRIFLVFTRLQLLLLNLIQF